MIQGLATTTTAMGVYVFEAVAAVEEKHQW